MRRRVAWVVMWLAGAVLAAGGATAALDALGSGLFGTASPVLTQAEVHTQLAQLPSAGPASQPSPAPVKPGPSHSASPPSAPAAVPFSGTGGTVFASCSAGQVTLTSSVPAQGYQVESSGGGPAASAVAEFSSGQTEVRVTAACSGGQPTVTRTVDQEADEHGGGGGRGGGGRGGGGRGGGKDG